MIDYREMAPTICNIYQVKFAKVNGVYAVIEGEEPSVNNIYSIHSSVDMPVLKGRGVTMKKEDKYICLLFRYSKPEVFGVAGYVFPSFIRPYVEPKKKEGGRIKQRASG